MKAIPFFSIALTPMITPTEKTPSLSGLMGCLGIGILVICLITGAFLYFKGRTDNTEERVTSEFLNPYLAAFRAEDPTFVWQTLTTESYRQRHSQESHAANFRLALQRLGPPDSVTVTRLTATHEPGRSYQRVKTRWKYLNAPEFFRTFKLIDVPNQGYRLDEANLNGQAPSSVPPDPW